MKTSDYRERAPAHGYKARIAADKDSGIVRAVETAPANEADVSIAPAIVPDEPGEVYAGRAYDVLAVEKAIEAAGGTSRLMRKGHRHLPAERLKAHNRPLRLVRGRIEKIFGTWKRTCRFQCMRWIGLSKAKLQVRPAAIASNVERHGACEPPERFRKSPAKFATSAQARRSTGDFRSATIQPAFAIPSGAFGRSAPQRLPPRTGLETFRYDRRSGFAIKIMRGGPWSMIPLPLVESLQ